LHRKAKLAKQNSELPYFGQRIKAARERLGLTQKELAVQINRSQDTIWSYEAGTLKPRLDDIPQLARILDVPITYFFEDGIPGSENKA
jgi:repressor LexA